MDFEVFERSDVEELFQHFVENAPAAVTEAAVQEFGSMEAFRRNYVEKAYVLYNQPETKEILLEAYGDKQSIIDAAVNPPGEDGVKKLQGQTDAVCRRLAQVQKRGSVGNLAGGADAGLRICPGNENGPPAEKRAAGNAGNGGYL